jgi:hypothetical protein
MQKNSVFSRIQESFAPSTSSLNHNQQSPQHPPSISPNNGKSFIKP